MCHHILNNNSYFPYKKKKKNPKQVVRHRAFQNHPPTRTHKITNKHVIRLASCNAHSWITHPDDFFYIFLGNIYQYLYIDYNELKGLSSSSFIFIFFFIDISINFLQMHETKIRNYQLLSLGFKMLLASTEKTKALLKQ